MGTREALFGINVLVQRCCDVFVYVSACFIDFQKALGRVKHDICMSRHFTRSWSRWQKYSVNIKII